MVDLVISEIKKDRDRVIDFIYSNVKPKEGIYIVVDIDKPFDDSNFSNYLVVDKKVDRFISAFVAENCLDKDTLRSYIAERDFMSKLLNSDANKAIDAPNKKILSTVYMCLSFNSKTASLNGKTEIETIEGLTNHIIENGLGYYRNIRSKVDEALSLKKNEKYCKDIIDALEYSQHAKRLGEIDEIEFYIKGNLEAIVSFAQKKGLPADGVVKIFFTSLSGKIDDSKEAYTREENFYLYRCLLNSKDLQVINGKLKGTTVYGFNNNTKKTGIKPLCLNINLTKYLSMDEAMDYRIAFQFLETVSVNNGARAFGLDMTSKDLQFANDVEDNINEKINITDFTHNVEEKGLVFKLHYKDKNIIMASTNAFVSGGKKYIANKRINLKNYLSNKELDFIVDKEKSKDDTVIVKNPTVVELLARIGFCWSKNLNFYSDFGAYNTRSIPRSHNLAANMEIIYNKYQNLMHSFLYSITPDISTTSMIINNYVDECINTYINDANNYEYAVSTLIRLLNYKLNLVDEFKVEGNGLILLNIADRIREKLEKAVDEGIDFDFENEAEYYYTLGQLAFYVEYQVQKKLDLSPFKEYTSRRTAKDMVNHLITRMDLYGYSINPSNKVFRAVASKVLLTGEITGKVRDNLTFFYGGIASDNIFLRKQEKTAGNDTENQCNEQNN